MGRRPGPAQRLRLQGGRQVQARLPVLPNPTVPVTIDWSERDHILPLHMADLARERIPQAEHVTLPGCGNMPMSDDPALICSVVLDTIAAAAKP